ncbi:MAG TPA: hypothetical protein PLD88_10415, partial [Candidatus Berkiella sp.]|nr:hypothetical protein [Candidatus Berkiella sp.]
KEASDPKLIEALLPYCLIEGLPLSQLLTNLSYFNSNNRRMEFLNCISPVRFIKSKNLLPPITIAALKLLSNARKVDEYEASLTSDDESAMADSKVARANWHFENKVKPHFNNAMASYGLEPIIAIEKEIRELLLNTILKQAQEDNERNVIAFINENKEKLIGANAAAMQASITVFTQAHPAQSAWRGYNAYAPVSGGWGNLLTPPADNAAIFSTITAHQGELRAQAASDILRERVAYYYLAVMDVNDGDDNTRAIRIENFISQLADIRNAHGRDDPSCYPGALTRCSDMGAFHTIAQLPPATKELIADFVKVKALAAFRDEMDNLTTFSEKETLYQALVELTTSQAKDVILSPERYPSDWLTIRQGFINKVGTTAEIVVQIFESDLFPITNADQIFVEQALRDIAGGTTTAALADCFHRHTDSVPILADIQNANPFVDNSPEYKLTGILLNTLLQAIPVYAISTRKLNNLGAYLASKVPDLVKGASITNFLAGLEIADEHFNEVSHAVTLALDHAGWKAPILIVNPFDGQIKRMELLIKNLPPEKATPYRCQLESLKKKQQYFNDHLPIVQQVFQGIQAECLVRLTQALASHLATSDEGFVQAEFCSFLGDDDHRFVQEYGEQLEALGEREKNDFKFNRL